MRKLKFKNAGKYDLSVFRFASNRYITCIDKYNNINIEYQIIYARSISSTYRYKESSRSCSQSYPKSLCQAYLRIRIFVVVVMSWVVSSKKYKPDFILAIDICE